MAIGAPTLLDSGEDNTTGVTSKSTSIVTPSAGAVLKLGIMLRLAGGTDNPTVSGAGLTWTLVDVRVQSFHRLLTFRGTGTPSTGALTVARGGATTLSQMSWLLSQYLGADTANPIVQNIGGTSASALTVNYPSAFLTGSAAVDFAANDNTTSRTVRSGWTELAAVNFAAGEGRLSHSYRLAGDTAAEANWVGVAGTSLIAMELRDAPSGALSETVSDTSTLTDAVAQTLAFPRSILTIPMG